MVRSCLFCIMQKGFQNSSHFLSLLHPLAPKKLASHITHYNRDPALKPESKKVAKVPIRTRSRDFWIEKSTAALLAHIARSQKQKQQRKRVKQEEESGFETFLPWAFARDASKQNFFGNQNSSKHLRTLPSGAWTGCCHGCARCAWRP